MIYQETRLSLYALKPPCFSPMPPFSRLNIRMVGTSIHLLYRHYSSCARRLDMPNPDTFWHEFNKLDNMISTFIDSLPQVIVVSRGENCERLIASTIARVASIQLHVRFARDQARSRQRCILAANAIVTSVRDIRVNELGWLDPIMAVSLRH